jgi:hypothetical protein
MFERPTRREICQTILRNKFDVIAVFHRQTRLNNIMNAQVIFHAAI